MKEFIEKMKQFFGTLTKWMKKHPYLTALIAIALVTFVTLLVLSVFGVIPPLANLIAVGLGLAATSATTAEVQKENSKTNKPEAVDERRLPKNALEAMVKLQAKHRLAKQSRSSADSVVDPGQKGISFDRVSNAAPVQDPSSSESDASADALQLATNEPSTSQAAPSNLSQYQSQIDDYLSEKSVSPMQATEDKAAADSYKIVYSQLPAQPDAYFNPATSVVSATTTTSQVAQSAQMTEPTTPAPAPAQASITLQTAQAQSSHPVAQATTSVVSDGASRKEATSSSRQVTYGLEAGVNQTAPLPAIAVDLRRSGNAAISPATTTATPATPTTLADKAQPKAEATPPATYSKPKTLSSNVRIPARAKGSNDAFKNMLAGKISGAPATRLTKVSTKTASSQSTAEATSKMAKTQANQDAAFTNTLLDNSAAKSRPRRQNIRRPTRVARSQIKALSPTPK